MQKYIKEDSKQAYCSVWGKTFGLLTEKIVCNTGFQESTFSLLVLQPGNKNFSEQGKIIDFKELKPFTESEFGKLY